MAAATKTKAADRQNVCKKLQTLLKKRYTAKAPKIDLPVLEMMLFSACLENSTWEDAEAAHERLHSSFHDLNEIRVSSVKEAETVFEGLSDPDWRALRVRSLLQFVFEDTYSFEYEGLKRKTLDSANKQLLKINHMTPFMRLFTLQQCLGSHLAPADAQMSHALIWLGLAVPGSSTEDVSDILKSSVRKADSPLFCYLIRCLATDPKFAKFFGEIEKDAPEEGWDLETAVDRLDRLFKRGVSAFQKPKKKRTVKKGTKTTKKVKKKSTTSSTKKSTKTSTTRKKATGKKVKVAKPKTAGKTSASAKTAKKKAVRKKR